jgi:hypothetical protein
MHTEQGLLRTLSFEKSGQVVADLNLYYRDIYDSLEATHENMRDLESFLDTLFYGEGREQNERDRSRKDMIR